jgi:hypothetical protein
MHRNCGLKDVRFQTEVRVSHNSSWVATPASIACLQVNAMPPTPHANLLSDMQYECDGDAARPETEQPAPITPILVPPRKACHTPQ